MSAALQNEAQKLYHDAKLASFAGRFDEAEAKHVSCAYIYERLGEKQLAARALMRALWYKIQNRTDMRCMDHVYAARQLCPLQTMSGLHQALEFAMLEGTSGIFLQCQSVLKELLIEFRLPIPFLWDEPDKWGIVYAEVAEPVYLKMVKEASERGWDKWRCSDQARLFYFRATFASPIERSFLLNEAAKLFERHDIPYRSLLCHAEATLWKACQSKTARAVCSNAEASLITLRSIGSFSLGILTYKKILMTLAEYLLASASVPIENKDRLTARQTIVEIIESPTLFNLKGVFFECLIDTFIACSGTNERVASELSKLDIANREIVADPFYKQQKSFLLSRTSGFSIPNLFLDEDNQGGEDEVQVIKRRLIKKPLGQHLLLMPATTMSKCVVFIHGLNGHYIDTWGAFPDLLMNDDDFVDTGFFFWSFPTGLWGRKPGIKNVAEALGTELRTRFSNCDLVIVGHSLGGLIAKNLVLTEILDRKTVLAERFKWLILYGTPHLGSQLASLGAVFAEQVGELRLDGNILAELEKRWVNEIYRNRQTGPLVQMTNVRGLEDRIVTEWSSSTVNEDCETIAGTHTTIVKPKCPDDLGYLVLKDRIRQAFNAGRNTK